MLTIEWWLAYLRKHAGTVEASTLLVDVVCHSSRSDGITITSALLVAYGMRVVELKERIQ